MPQTHSPRRAQRGSKLALLAAAAATLPFASAFSFQVDQPTQCGRWTVQWDGGSGPFNLIVVPLAESTTGQILNISMPATGSPPYRHSFTLSEPAGMKIVATMYDSTGWGSGGATQVLTVGQSSDTSCLHSTIAQDFYFWSNPEDRPSQCQDFEVVWDDSDRSEAPGGLQGDVGLLGIVPGGTVFEVPVSVTAQSRRSVHWKANLAAGSEFLFLMTDRGPYGSGGSIFWTIGGSSDSSCLDGNNPHTTSVLPFLTSASLTTVGATPTRTIISATLTDAVTLTPSPSSSNSSSPSHSGSSSSLSSSRSIITGTLTSTSNIPTSSSSSENPMATRVLTKTVSPSDTTDDSSASPSSSPAATSEDGAPGSRNAGKVAGIVAGAVGGSAAIAAAIWYLLRKRDGCALEQARARSPSFITPTPMEEKFKNNSWFNRSGERQSWRRFKPGRGDARLSSEDGLPRHRADGAGAPATYTNRSSRYYSNTGRTNVPDVSAVEFCEDSPSFRSALPYAQRESNGMNLETLNSPASQKDRFSHMPPNFPTSRYQVDSRLDPLPPLPSSHDRMISAPSPALIRPTVDTAPRYNNTHAESSSSSPESLYSSSVTRGGFI